MQLELNQRLMLDAWASPVAAWFRNNGHAQFEANNLARVALLTQLAREVGAVEKRISKLVDCYQALLTSLSRLNTEAFAARRTPFVMMSVNRTLAAATAGNSAELARSLSTTILQLFDSFFVELPMGTAIDLDPDLVGTPVHLIACSKKFELPRQGPVRLTKNSEERVILTTPSGHQEILLTRTAQNGGLDSPRTLPVGQDFSLLVESGPTLFEPEYEFKCYPEIPHPEQLATMISDSLEIIFSVWPELKGPFTKIIRYFVPILQTEAYTHNSFSAQSMVGVIFVSETYDDLKLVEAIVHEFHHNELYMYMQVEELLGDRSRNTLYYSPWRADPRPLFGLLHACYVFTAVAHYLRAAEHCSKLSKLATYFSRGRKQVVERLGWALGQVRESDVTPAGRALANWMLNELRCHVSDFGHGSFCSVSSEQSAHLSTWCRAYPELAASIRKPLFSKIGGHD